MFSLAVFIQWIGLDFLLRQKWSCLKLHLMLSDHYFARSMRGQEASQRLKYSGITEECYVLQLWTFGPRSVDSLLELITIGMHIWGSSHGRLWKVHKEQHGQPSTESEWK